MAVRGQKNQTVPIIIGKCPLLLNAIDLIERAAKFPDIGVLILGETGTGKELAVQKYHEASGLTGLLVAVNCAAIAPSLLESLLFGHERGAFTGADRRQIGLLEQANGGTLFLDEIGEMPLELQRALLRAMESRTIRRVGGTQTIPIDIRIVAATNRDLKGMVEAKTFRRDLFYRICNVTVRIPPLRQRGKDALLIARSYLDELSGRGHPKKRLSKEAEQFIREYPWPGNVRELKMALRTQSVHCPGDLISERTLKISLDLDVWTATKLTGDARRQSVVELLREMGPLKSTAIRRALFIPSTTLFNDLQQLIARGRVVKRKSFGRVSYLANPTPHRMATVQPLFSEGIQPEYRFNSRSSRAGTNRPASFLRNDGTTLYEMILRYLADNRFATAAELERVSRSSRSHVTRCLNSLIADGHVLRVGKGKNTKYVLAEDTDSSVKVSGHEAFEKTGQVEQTTGQDNPPFIIDKPELDEENSLPETGQVNPDQTQTGQVERTTGRDNPPYINENPESHPKISLLKTGQVDPDLTGQTSTIVVLTDKHRMLLEFIRHEPRSLKSMMKFLKKSHRETFMKNWVRPLRDAGLIALTIPEKPHSSRQKYRVTTRPLISPTKGRSPE